jgi:hypothetical protein
MSRRRRRRRRRRRKEEDLSLFLHQPSPFLLFLLQLLVLLPQCSRKIHAGLSLSFLPCARSVLPYNRSLLPYTKSLLPYTRPLFALY